MKRAHRHGYQRTSFAFAALLALASATPGTAQASDNAGQKSGSLEQADGKAIFQHICQGCHMPDARGAIGAGTYPPLAGNPRLVSPQYMAAIIIHGRRDMPAFGPAVGDDESFFNRASLSDAQIANVINYVRQHFGNTYADTISATDVAAIPH